MAASAGAMDAPYRLFFVGLKSVAKQLNTRSEHCVEALRTLGEQATRIDSFEGQEIDLVCFLVCLGGKADAKTFKELKVLLSVVAEAVGRVAVSDGHKGTVLARVLESVVVDVAKLVATGGDVVMWPQSLKAFGRLDGALSALHEKGDPNRLLSDFQGFPEVLLNTPAEAFGMGATAATLLSLYSSPCRSNIHGTALNSMTALAGCCDWLPWGAVLVEAIAKVLETGVSFAHPKYYELLRRTALRAVCNMEVANSAARASAWEKALCEMLWHADLVDASKSESDVLAGALTRVPLGSEFWRILFRQFVDSVRHAQDNEGRLKTLLESVSPQGCAARRREALRLLRELCERLPDFARTDAVELTSVVVAWLKTGGQEFSDDELAVLISVAVATCVRAFSSQVPLDELELCGAALVLLDKASGRGVPPRDILCLRVFADALHVIHSQHHPGHRLANFATLLDCVGGAGGAEVLCLAPFAFRLNGQTAMDCVAALSSPELIQRVAADGLAFANCLGFVGTAFCKSARDDGRFFLKGLACACHHICHAKGTHHSVPDRPGPDYPVSGELVLQMSALGYLCNALLGMRDKKVTKSLLSSMVPILGTITDDGLQESKPVLEALLAGTAQMEWCRIELFMEAFLRDSVLSEWSGCPAVQAKETILREIWGSSMDRNQVVQFFRAFYDQKICPELVTTVVSYLIQILRSDGSFSAEIALGHIARCENTTLHDMILRDGGQSFRGVFTHYPDVMDTVSHLIKCDISELPKCYVRYALDMIWEGEGSDGVGRKILGDLSHRIPPAEWKLVFLREFRASLVAALWRRNEGVWKNYLRIAQEMSGIEQGEWDELLASEFDCMSSLVIRCAGQEFKGDSLDEGAAQCLSRLRMLTTVCKTGKQNVKDFLDDSLLVRHILVPLNSKLGAKVGRDKRMAAWKSLQILLRLFGEAGSLTRYSPQCLALVKAGLLNETEEQEACKGLEVLKSIMDTAMLRVAGDNLNILQEIVVSLAPALATKNEAHRAACHLLKELVSKSSKHNVRRLAALTFGVLHINHTQCNRECPILAEIFGDLHAAGFFTTSRDRCPLFEELCATLASGCGPVLMEGVSSMREFLEENTFWIRKMACGDMGPKGLERAKQAVGILAMCLNKTGRSSDGLTTNAKCARCLGMIGIVDPSMGHPTTFISLDIPKSEDVMFRTLLKNLERILFSGGIHSVEIASRALCGLRQSKMIKPQFMEHLSPWLSQSCLKGSDVLLEVVTAEMLLEVGDLSLRRWLYMWLVFLHDKAWGKLSANNIKVAVAAMEHDVPSMISLFPFLMYHAISRSGLASMGVIADGLLAVLNEADNSECQRFDTQKCQMVFLLLDSLHGLLPEGIEERNQSGIGQLFSRLDGTLLANAAFKCGAYTRALRYLEEQLMRQHGGGPSSRTQRSSAFKPEEVTFLMQIYAQLGELDGLSGLAHLSAEPWHVIALAEENCEWDSALREWHLRKKEIEDQEHAGETLSQRVEPTTSDMGSRDQILRGQLRCLLKAGRFHDIKHSFATSPGYECAPWAFEQISALECEALWKMGDWTALGTCLHKLDEKKATGGINMLLPSPQEEFSLSIGRMLLILQERRSNMVERFEHESKKALLNILRDIPARAAESYIQACPLVARLEILQDIRYAQQLLQNGDFSDNILGHLMWGSSSDFLDALPESKQSRIYFRRQLATIMQDSTEHHRCSMEVIKMAGQAGINVDTMLWLNRVPGSLLEYDKALRRVGKKLDLCHLKDALAQANQGSSDTVDDRYKAGLMLALARRAEEFCTAPSERTQETIKLLQEASSLDNTWVKPCLEHARFLDKLYVSQSSIDTGEISIETAQLLPEVIASYARAASMSDKHGRDCVSRILTLYFQYGEKVMTDFSLERVEQSVHTTMTRVRDTIPLALWYTSLPTLLSRICHQHKVVLTWIIDTMSKLANAFPHQTLWGMAMAINSKNTDRRKAAKEILRRFGGKDLRKGQALASTFHAFSKELLNLCTISIDKNVVKIDAAKRLGGLYDLAGCLSHDLIIPCERYMRGRFPGPNWADSRVPPGAGLPTIVGMKKEIRVMTSLVKPRKIILLGSDGQEYPFLAKPKDDLRKDNRLMEFCWVLNDYFQRHEEGRKRELRMRTYMVIPLMEKSGILEWVEGIASFRELCEGIYRSEGQALTHQTVHALAKANPKTWLDIVTSRYKPCFHKWFLRIARRPDEWMEMRLSFTRSAAVWSMVGHMLGLGDRHPENVNVDRATGAIIHVDFGCLFDDGQRLPVPELTPFRLTPNMVDAFGVSGVNGVFMNSASIVLKVIRESHSLLLTIMEAFLYDPLVQWVRGDRNVKDILFTVKGRMTGRLLGVKGIKGGVSRVTNYEFSTVREQCDFLVGEATDFQNLQKMFLGWMPWM